MVIGELCPPTPTPTQPGWTASQFEGSQGRERRPGWTSPRVERQMTKCHSCCSPEMKMLNLPRRQFWLTWRFMRTSGAIQRTGSPPEVLFSSSTEAYREWESPKSETFATVPFWASRMFLWVGWDQDIIHSCQFDGWDITWPPDRRALFCAAPGIPSHDSPATARFSLKLDKDIFLTW